MGHYQRFCTAYQKASNGIAEARKNYLNRLEKIGGYENSTRYDHEREQIESEFKNRVREIQRGCRDTLVSEIQAMRAAVKPRADAPSAEIMAMIDALEKIDAPDPEIVAACAEKIGDSELAFRALESVLMRKGHTMPDGLLPLSQRVRIAVQKLGEAAESIQGWDGRTRDEISKSLIQARHDWRWGGGPAVNANDRAGLVAGEIFAANPGELPMNIGRRIVGSDPAVLGELEKL